MKFPRATGSTKDRRFCDCEREAGISRGADGRGCFIPVITGGDMAAPIHTLDRWHWLLLQQQCPRETGSVERVPVGVSDGNHIPPHRAPEQERREMARTPTAPEGHQQDERLGACPLEGPALWRDDPSSGDRPVSQTLAWYLWVVTWYLWVVTLGVFFLFFRDINIVW